MTVKLDIDSREVRRALRTLRGPKFGRLAAGAINKTMFEMREAEAEEVQGTFQFSGPATRNFLGGKRSFRFRGATATRLSADLFPSRIAAKILEDHVEGTTVTATDGERLAFMGRLAVPINVKRGARGRVSKKMRPSEIIQRPNVFVTKDRTAILERKKGGQVKVLYALIPSAYLFSIYDFYGVAEDTARAQLPVKVRRVLDKELERELTRGSL